MKYDTLLKELSNLQLSSSVIKRGWSELLPYIEQGGLTLEEVKTLEHFVGAHLRRIEESGIILNGLLEKLSQGQLDSETLAAYLTWS